MKVIFILFNLILLISANSIAGPYTLKWYNEEKLSDKIELPNKSNFSSFTSSGIWEDNVGNYGKMKCVISFFTDYKQDIELTGYCEATDSNKEKFWTKLQRSSLGIDKGIGKITFLDGTSKYSRLKKISCPYASEWIDDGGIMQIRCKVELDIKNLLN